MLSIKKQMVFKQRALYVKIFLIIFYMVGYAGLTIPQTSNLFIDLVPFSLLLSFTILLLFHAEIWDVKTIIVFLIIFIVGFFIEVAGVNTGVIFGQYKYGETLGLQVFNTPLIIGMNWLLLTYSSASVIRLLNVGNFLKIFLPSIFMLSYDLVLEQVAPDLGMWSWENEVIPLQNYFAWFVISLFFQFLFYRFKVNTTNKIAPFIFLIQFLFFLSLLFTKLIIK